MSTVARMPLGILLLVRYVCGACPLYLPCREGPLSRCAGYLDAFALVSFCPLWHENPLSKAIWWP